MTPTSLYTASPSKRHKKKKTLILTIIYKVAELKQKFVALRMEILALPLFLFRKHFKHLLVFLNIEENDPTTLPPSRI